MPLVLPLPELTVLSEFWLPCGVRLPSASEAGCVPLWCEDAGEGTSGSAGLGAATEAGLREGGAHGGGPTPTAMGWAAGGDRPASQALLTVRQGLSGTG